MDEVDIAERATEALMAARLAQVRERKDEAPHTGHCLNCGEPLPAGRRWCDADCRDEWEARNEKRLR